MGTFRGGRLSRGQRALLRRTLGIIYQDFRLLNDRTVFENVALAVRIAGAFDNEEVIPRVLLALDEVRDQLPSAVQDIKDRERWEAWIKTLRDKAHVEIRGS